jgi:hypothetical protein
MPMKIIYYPEPMHECDLGAGKALFQLDLKKESIKPN